MEKLLQRLYLGRIADLSDILVKECIDRKESIKVRIKGDTDVMTLTPEQLVSKRKAVSKSMFKGRNGSADYYLYSYEWNPDKIDY